MNKKGLLMWLILAGFFILVLTSLGIYIGLSNGGVQIGLEGASNQTTNNITLESISNHENPSNISIIEENSTLNINKNHQNNSVD